MKNRFSKTIAHTGILATIILLSGIIKIPSVFPGGEFQLSAPIAVLICALFGFNTYITVGVLASVLGLILGLTNIFNIIIAMTFRLVVGLIIAVGGKNFLTLIVAGPIGTIMARLTLAQITQVDWQILVIAAVPGMLYTAITILVAYKPAQILFKRMNL